MRIEVGKPNYPSGRQKRDIFGSHRLGNC